MVHLIEERTHALGLFGESQWLIALKFDRLLFPSLVKQSNQFRQAAFCLVQSSMKPQCERDSSDILKHLMEVKTPSGTEGLTQQDLYAEAVVMIVAGSDTTSTTLAALFFYILSQSSCLRKGG